MPTNFDDHTNLGRTTVFLPPVPALSGTSMTLDTGGGSVCPLPPFNALVWPNNALPSTSNAEYVRVTAMTGDVINTMVRAQEGSTAKPIGGTYQFAVVATRKTFEDIEAAVNALGTTQHVIPTAGDNLWDVGSAALRFRDGYFGTSLKLGASPQASAGLIRLPDAAVIAWRNAANTADYLFYRNSSTGFSFVSPTTGNVVVTLTAPGAGTGAFITLANAVGSVGISNDTAGDFNIDAVAVAAGVVKVTRAAAVASSLVITAGLTSVIALAAGAGAKASVGDIRLSSAGSIQWRNAANNADLSLALSANILSYTAPASTNAHMQLNAPAGQLAGLSLGVNALTNSIFTTSGGDWILSADGVAGSIIAVTRSGALGSSLVITAGKITGLNVIDATVGFRVANAAANGMHLVGNGTNFVGRALMNVVTANTNPFNLTAAMIEGYAVVNVQMNVANIVINLPAAVSGAKVGIINFWGVGLSATATIVPVTSEALLSKAGATIIGPAALTVNANPFKNTMLTYYGQWLEIMHD